MKLHRIAVLALVTLSLVAAAVALADAAGRKANSREARVERGRYLTLMGGCNDCHTPGTFYGSSDYERTLSGSEVGWEGPWGVTFPRNLTPDLETGLGAWSEQDIVNAIRTGMRPDGSVILPPMPWPMYATMTDDDAFAIAAYLKSIPPVKHRAPNRVAPGTRFEGAALRFPPPPAWDAPRGNPTSANH